MVVFLMAGAIARMAGIVESERQSMFEQPFQRTIAADPIHVRQSLAQIGMPEGLVTAQQRSQDP